MSLHDDETDEIFEGAWGDPAPDTSVPESAVQRPPAGHPAHNHPAFGPGRDRKDAQAKPPLPDLDEPPAAAEPIVPFSLRDRFDWAGPASDFFPVIVSLMAVAAVLLAGFGPLGRLAAFTLAGAWWVLGIRIHVTEEHRLTLHLAEATLIGLLVYWS